MTVVCVGGVWCLISVRKVLVELREWVAFRIKICKDVNSDEYVSSGIRIAVHRCHALQHARTLTGTAPVCWGFDVDVLQREHR